MPTKRCARGILSSSAVLSLVVSSMLLLFRAQSVYGYANWLKCYVELDDPEEAIMNRGILPADEQPQDERVYLEVQPYASRRRDPWWASSTRTNHGDLFPSNATNPILVKLRLRVPPKLKNKDVQFVVEATGEGVSFVGQGVMCDGKRAFSRQHDTPVLMQIHTAVEDGGEADADADSDGSTTAHAGNIELVAGWAAGYEAVKLTPTMILRRNNGNYDSNGTFGGDGSENYAVNDAGGGSEL